MKSIEWHSFPRIILLCTIALLVNSCASNTKSFRINPNLVPREEIQKILLMPMNIQLSTVPAFRISNKPEPEWTAQANKHVEKAVREQMAQIGIHVLGPADVEEIELNADEKEKQIQLIKLHEAVGHSIFWHELTSDGLKLPGKNDKFDYSIGPEAKFLKEKYGADYALFVYLRDSYASAGKIALSILMVVIAVATFEATQIGGGRQFGFASLVDLETGDVVWINRICRGTGDLRTQEAASNSVKVLLNNFPKLSASERSL